MSSPPKPIPPAPPKYNGQWNHPRFVAACVAVGITSDTALRDRVNAYRLRTGVEQRYDLRTARAYLSGEVDPTRSRVQSRAPAFELAAALGVSLNWLTSTGPAPKQFVAEIQLGQERTGRRTGSLNSELSEPSKAWLRHAEACEPLPARASRSFRSSIADRLVASRQLLRRVGDGYKLTAAGKRWVKSEGKS